VIEQEFIKKINTEKRFFLYSRKVFISMGSKVQHLRIRITEGQYRILSQLLLGERRSKSQIVRDAINMYVAENLHKKEEEKIRPPAGQ